MAAPKYIIEKAEALQRALNLVDKLSYELEAWVDVKTGDGGEGLDFFLDYHLDNPYEFDLESVKAALDEYADR